MLDFLSVVDKVDNFTYEENHSNYRLVTHDGQTTLGLIDETVAKHLKGRSEFVVNGRSIQIGPQYDTFDKRNDMFRDLALELKAVSEFDEELAKGWRNELYVVYCPTTIPYMLIERSFSVLIGVVTYGVHLTGYVAAKDSSNGKLKLWVPRRSDTKPTFPSMYDNTVAGGLGHPYGLWETVIKESYEEAGLEEDFVVANTQAAGLVQYIYQTPKGRVQPEVEYLYDIRFPNETDVVPHPVDGESQDFQLLEVDQVISRLDQFKPNCALVIVDFLIRHGYITATNEPNYAQLLTRSHRRFPYPTM